MYPPFLTRIYAPTPPFVKRRSAHQMVGTVDSECESTVDFWQGVHTKNSNRAKFNRVSGAD